MLSKIFGVFIWLLEEVKTLYHLLFSPIKGSTHQDRLESFYKTQAANYDAYRKRLLHGRQELFLSLPTFKKGSVWVDLGAGTGSNVEYMQTAGQLKNFSKVYLVDLSTSLLKRADKYIEDNDWSNVQTVVADATTYAPPEKVDLVTFSYSLTMIPDWFSAVENALRILKPGGVIAVVDFYTSRKYPSEGRVKHSWFRRTFWQLFFGFDNVNLNPDHLPYLVAHTDEDPQIVESLAPVPYIPLLKVPNYRFIGRKRDD